jgi:hypothetical protein
MDTHGCIFAFMVLIVYYTHTHIQTHDLFPVPYDTNSPLSQATTKGIFIHTITSVALLFYTTRLVISQLYVR